MTKPIDESNLLVGLDEIFDTRFGTILRHWEDKVDDVIKSGYHNRITDDFPGIDPEEFKEKYAARDGYTLANSIVTPVLEFVYEFCKATYLNNYSSPFTMSPKVSLNVYPYKLPQDVIDLIHTTVIRRTAKLAEIVIVDIPYKEITPAILKNEVAIFLHYDPLRWIEDQTLLGNFKRNSCPTVELIGPSVMYPGVKGVSTTEYISSVATLTRPLVNTKLLDVGMFSFIKPKT